MAAMPILQEDRSGEWLVLEQAARAGQDPAWVERAWLEARAQELVEFQTTAPPAGRDNS